MTYRVRATKTAVCDSCGKTFSARLDAVNRGNGRFCGRKCSWDAKRKPIGERFWKKVERTDTCWLWTGGIDSSGYGQIWHDSRVQKAHRVSWEIANGPIPDGLFVLHDCPDGDNPRCVRPSHLWLGDHDANRADCVAKGRQAKRDADPRSVTEPVVREVLVRTQMGHSKRVIADELGIGTTTVGLIRTGRHWTARNENVDA